jgi:nucleotide-binding universal stress UspA family protein
MKADSFLGSDTGWLAVDGSLASRSAALVGLTIASLVGLRLRSITLGDEPAGTATLSFDGKATWSLAPMADAVRGEPAGLISEATTRALQWLGSQALLAQVPLLMHVEVGDIAAHASRLAGQSAFLALGRRGIHHQGKRGYLGRHLLEIIQKARCPLLIGGEQAPPTAIRAILLADDFGPASLRASAWAAHLQRALSCLVGIVNLEPELDWNRLVAQEASPLPADGPRGDAGDALSAGVKPAYRADRSAERIMAAASESRGDLIVMGCRRPYWAGQGSYGRLINVLRICELPVLAVF